MKEGKMITNWKYNKWKKEWNPKSNALENYGVSNKMEAISENILPK